MTVESQNAFLTNQNKYNFKNTLKFSKIMIKQQKKKKINNKNPLPHLVKIKISKSLSGIFRKKVIMLMYL